MTPGEAQWRLTYEISPIFLTGGIAGNMPGATVPLLSYTEGAIFGSVLDAGIDRDLDSFFAHFRVLPGNNLINCAVGQYPFANQAVAGNAIITEPLRISLAMICPARNRGDYLTRQAVMTSLKRTLDSHILAGGTFTVATPTFMYTDCLLLNVEDASAGETRQPQYQYVFNFLKPLISEQEAQQTYNNLMAKIGAQTQLTPDQATWSGLDNTVGNPASGAAPDVVPPTRVDPGQGFAPSSFTSSSAAVVNVPGFASTPATTAAVTPPTGPAPTLSEALSTASLSVPSAFGP